MDITQEPETHLPTRIQPTKQPPPLSNGILKRYHHHPPAVVVTYKECLKNHAAALGGHALDGCGEFMPSPSVGATDPTSLNCTACGCHRNFHRRDTEEPSQVITRTITATATRNVIEYQSHHRHHPPPPTGTIRSPNSASPPPISSAYYPSAPHMLISLPAGVSTPLESVNATATAAAAVPAQIARKRVRTKFSETQKEKMHEFAEQVEWKMQKRDKELVHKFCNEIGVDKSVLKVWMHNNKKNIIGKKDLNNGNHHSEHEPNYSHSHGNDGRVVDHVLANGSSSSS